MEEPIISLVAVNMDEKEEESTDEEDNSIKLGQTLSEELANEGSCDLWNNGDLRHQYCCNKCGLMTVTQRELENHVQEDHHHNIEKLDLGHLLGKNRENTDAALPWDAYRGYKASGKQRERRFQCDLCGYKAGQPGHLASHKRMHIGDKWFVCSDCGYRTHTASHLRRHHHSVHSAERPYRCKYCDYATAQPYNLKHHMKRHFPKQERKFPCSLCSYRAIDLRGLQKHSRKHSANYSAFNLGSLLEPWNTFASRAREETQIAEQQRTNERAVVEFCNTIILATQRLGHECSDCDYLAPDSRELAIHKRTHRKVLHCDHCGYRSQDPSNMKKHLMTHRPKRDSAQDYPCHECTYVADTLFGLRDHWYRRHSYRYVCNDCGYSVVYRKQLVQHIKEEHPTHESSTNDDPEVLVLSSN